MNNRDLVLQRIGGGNYISSDEKMGCNPDVSNLVLLFVVVRKVTEIVSYVQGLC